MTKKTSEPTIKVSIEAPNGRIIGNGNIVASADASIVRPQDCAPLLRAIIYPIK